MRGIMPDANDLLIRQLTELLPANSAAAKLLRFAFDDGTEDVEEAEAKQNTIGAVLDLIYALRGAVTASGITMATARMLGRTTASTGAVEEITVGSGLSLTAGALTAEVTAASMAAAISAAVTALFENKGNLDASANPNYPAATLNDAYRISVAGRVGGASGPKVSVGDWVIAIATNAGGTQASVGGSWDIWEGNIPGLTADGLSLIQAASFAAMRALLDLEAGVDFNVYRAELGLVNAGGTAIASAATVNLAVATGDYIHITGSTGPITSFGAIPAGVKRIIVFDSTPTITHHATTNILLTGANIVAAAGDIAIIAGEGSSNNRMIGYFRKDGTALVGASGGDLVPVALTYGATLSPAIGDGLYRKVDLSGSATLNPPSGSPSDGMKWRCRFTALTTNRLVTTHADIKVPSGSSYAGSQLISGGETWIMQLEYNSTLSKWMLTTLIGGWA